MHEITTNPLYVGNVVSEDGRTTALIMKIVSNPTMDNYQRKLTDLTYETLDQFKEEYGYQFHVAGPTALVGAEDKANTNDAIASYILLEVLLILLMFLIFRRVVLVVAPLLIVSLSIIWIHGLIPAAGSDYNLVTSIIATVVLMIGITGATHYIYEFKSEFNTCPDVKVASRRAFCKIFFPSLFSSISTAAGFFSMTVSQLVPIQEFGLFAGIAMLLTFFVSMVSMLILTSSLPAERTVAASHPRILDKIVQLAVSINRRHVGVNVLIALVLLAASFTGMRMIEVNTNVKEYFVDSHPYKRSVQFLEDELSGALTLEILLLAENGQFQNPDVLLKVEQFQHYLDSLPVILKTISAVDLIKEANKAVNHGDPTYFAIPQTGEHVARYALLSEASLKPFLDTTAFNATRVQARLRDLDSQEMLVLGSQIEKELAQLFDGEDVVSSLTGTMKLYLNAADYVIESQLYGFTTAFVAIFLLIALLLRSVKLAAISMIPNLIPVFLSFGMMGWFDINLDFGTVIIASVAMGLAVDDTIHFVCRFKEFYMTTGNYNKAIDETLHHVGRPIIVTTVVLFFGFCALLISTYKPIIYFGLLSALTMIWAVLADLFVLPALIKLFRPFGSEKHSVSLPTPGA